MNPAHAPLRARRLCRAGARTQQIKDIIIIISEGVVLSMACHALSAGEGLGDATLLRSWRAGVFSVLRIYFSATLRYASAMSRPNFTEVYYFSHAVLLPPDGATITIIPFLKTSPFLYVLFCWSKVASHPPMLAMKTFPFTSEMFYSCSLATATLATYAILSG